MSYKYKNLINNSTFQKINSKIIETVQCIFKLCLNIKIILEFGLFQGILLISICIILQKYILKFFFNLEKLSTNDLLFLGFKNSDRSNLMCLFFFENKINIEAIKERFIEKGIKQNKKFIKRLVKRFYSFYWEDVDIQESINRVRIVKETFVSRADIIEYSRKELNNHLNIIEELPFEFQLLKYSNKDGGAVLFKLDHTMSDVLGWIALTLSMSDNYSDDIIPSILKKKKKQPFYLEVLTNIFEFIMFPYYALRLLLNGMFHTNEENPFKRVIPPSGISLFEFTNSFEFDKLNKINKKLKISFNDLMLAIISSSINKYCLNNEIKYGYSKLICGIPIGIKDFSCHTSEIELKNDILGAIMEIKRIKDPLKEYDKISEETKKTIKNTSNIKSWTYLEFIFNQFVPYFLQKAIAINVGQTVDLAITNLPGPVNKISYCGCEVNEILPMMSNGFGLSSIIILTYNNTLRMTVCVEDTIKINSNALIKAINEEINSIIGKLE